MTLEFTLPPQLSREVSEGRAVLFLGAGASFGAQDDRGNTIPLAGELGELLAREFLTSYDPSEPFSVIYDYCCSSADTRRVQSYLRKVLEPFQPASYHKLLPTLPWHGIAGTNYDLIVERAFGGVPGVLPLAPIRDDADSIEDARTDGKLPYLKLHGCLTKADVVDPSMIASTEQLIRFREGRRLQLSMFMEWAQTKTIIFVGYRLLDPNIRTLFQEIIASGDNRPLHYIVLPNQRPEAYRYWSDRRVQLIDGTFEGFLRALSGVIDKNTATLSGVLSRMSSTSFSRYIDRPGGEESAPLADYLNKRIQHVSPDKIIPAADAKRFYSGFNQGWAPIAANLDIARPIGRDLLLDQVVPNRSKKQPRLIIVKGHAGSGKTVMLRRTAWDAFHRYERMVFFVARENVLSVPAFLEMANLSSIEPYIFIDNLEEHRQDVEKFMAEFSRVGHSATIVAAVDTNHWNMVCLNLHPLVDDEYDMRYLSMPEIDELLEKLKNHNSLGSLKDKSIEEQRDELKELFGRQLIVALLEATNGAPLYNILANEYRSIEPVEARNLYLNICSLHRFGPPVRAGLISRLSGVNFDEFKSKLLPPLEQIVRLRDDARTGDVVYEARHTHIASVVYEQAFQEEDARFDNVIDIVNQLNLAFSYDSEVLYQIMKAENLRKTFVSRARGRLVYDAAEEVAGPNFGLLHQRAIFEMNSAVTFADLDLAKEMLVRAGRVDGGGARSLKHTEAEIELRRSRLATDPLERESYRKYAIELASDLTTGGAGSSYPWHTILKAKIDRVKDVIELSGSDDRVAFAELDDAITDAESSIRRALQRFPNEAVLVAEEGNLQQILAHSTRAEEAFRRAFDLNPRSSLIAKKLALVRRAKEDLPGAIDVLRRSLEHNPGDGSLHYELARTLMSLSPDADLSNSQEILYHLKRAHHQGAKDQQVKFWYARQLSLSGQWEEARPLFTDMGALRVPIEDKKRVRGIIRDSANQNLVCTGRVVVARETYALVEDDRFSFVAIVAGKDMPLTGVREGQALKYEVGFTLKGPQAINVISY
ncbi:SIR2 family protein [Devosia sp.]|uniref:P-loop NTPase n=1 Tax=Devosia sp. TaxID=1871048 RepID=UPI001AFF2286|nr:SIR2 family protein [Devosia sp.]MBO9587327.1 SIR2 family protein [Devosia sp.]